MRVGSRPALDRTLPNRFRMLRSAAITHDSPSAAAAGSHAKPKSFARADFLPSKENDRRRTCRTLDEPAPKPWGENVPPMRAHADGEDGSEEGKHRGELWRCDDFHVLNDRADLSVPERRLCCHRALAPFPKTSLEARRAGLDNHHARHQRRVGCRRRRHTFRWRRPFPIFHECHDTLAILARHVTEVVHEVGDAFRVAPRQDGRLRRGWHGEDRRHTPMNTTRGTME
jgi:hypothetical protein